VVPYGQHVFVITRNVNEPKRMGKKLNFSTYIEVESLIFRGFILGTVGMFLSIDVKFYFTLIRFGKKPLPIDHL